MNAASRGRRAMRRTLSRGTAPLSAAVNANPRRRRTLSVLAIVLACYLSAALAVNLVLGPAFQDTLLNSAASFLFPRVGSSSQQLDTASINTEWNDIQQYFVYRDVPSSVGTQGAEQGIVERMQSLYNDQHMMFLTASDYTSQTNQLSGQRSGAIGISVEDRCAGGSPCSPGATPAEIVIADVLTGQPADQAGLKRGDEIIAVDGKPVTSYAAQGEPGLAKLTPLITGSPGSKVQITVQRGSQRVTAAATRQNLSIPSVYAKKLGSILYLQVTDFGTDTADLATKLLQQYKSGTTGIILDLREDGGGYVVAAQHLVSQFIAPSPSTRDVVVRRGRMDQTRNPATAQTVIEDQVISGGLFTSVSVPVVILVDGNTASAAEITTAALRDYHRALVIGTKTYGKGSVQQDFPLPDGNDLHLTVEKWYAPNGENVDGVGITPDDVVSIPSPEDRFRLDSQSPPISQDPQAEAALQVFRQPAAGG